MTIPDHPAPMTETTETDGLADRCRSRRAADSYNDMYDLARSLETRLRAAEERVQKARRGLTRLRKATRRLLACIEPVLGDYSADEALPKAVDSARRLVESWRGGE